METIDDETAAARDRLHQAPARGGQAVLRAGSTPPTCISAPTPSRRASGQAGRWQSPYHDTMIDHDKHVGRVAGPRSTNSGIADDTIVIYSTDNGPHVNTWPDGATTPFRSEKNTNWEGAFRVPQMIRWPGRIPAGVGVQRDRPAPRLAADAASRRRASPTSSRSSNRATDRRQDATRSTSTATTCCRT